jgi:hypothetical protein
VSALFAIATTVTPIPERWRPFIVWGAWLLLGGACFGWYLADHQIGTKRGHPVAIMMVGLCGAILSISIWLLVRPAPTVSSASTNPAASPQSGPVTSVGFSDHVTFRVTKLVPVESAKLRIGYEWDGSDKRTDLDGLVITNYGNERASHVRVKDIVMLNKKIEFEPIVDIHAGRSATVRTLKRAELAALIKLARRTKSITDDPINIPITVSFDGETVQGLETRASISYSRIKNRATIANEITGKVEEKK